ncbi:MAG: family 16 glycoside hydrolase [Pseudomonadota bacterium]
MLRMVVAVAVAAVLTSAGQSLACEGSEVLFEDKFQDDAGGWSQKKAVSIGDGALVFKLPADDMQSNLNVMFSVEDADVCVEAVWPHSEHKDVDKPQILGAGLLFWGENNRTYYQFGILNNGRYWIARKQDGAWVGTIAANIDSTAIKTAPGASNTLRVDAKGNSLGFYINGTKVREVRGQAPKGSWRFGVSGDNFDKSSEATVLFTNLKVTD